MIKYLPFICLFLFSCTATENEQKKVVNDNTTALQVKFASGFTINATDDGYDITVRNPQDTTDILGTYSLTKSDTSGISIPIETAVLNSTTFGAFFDHLDALTTVKGMTYTDRVKNRRILDLIESERIVEMISGDGLDFERLLELNPDVVFAYSFGEADFSRYEELGIPIVLLMDYKESHPLGRAEWIKVVGCLIGKYDEAAEIFNEVEKEYLKVKSQAMYHSTIPSAFTGSRYGDFWYAPGRDSYIAKFIRDAGAQYTFDHIEGQESAELDFEQALVTISEADYWGLVVSSEDPFTSADILEMSPLYENLKAFEDGNIFICNTAEKDYFGDAIMEPHLILSDLYHIFHPNVESDSTFHYFEPIH
ncbi:ABC transporter substrate-binding protein [Cryomorphaceae bacterium 1068]|nr:ABC transporter substrate-binding protein [Cryomorphaceae bacterium 1068]